MASQLELDQARAAYHQLMTGTKTVKLKHKDGREVEYQATNVKLLSAYIQRIERELDTTKMPRRPIGVC